MHTHLTEILYSVKLLTHSLNTKFFDSNELDRFYTDLKMEEKTDDFRYILLFYFGKGKNASQSYEKFREVYRDDARKTHQCLRWFAKFRCGDFDGIDVPRSGRPLEADDDDIKAMFESDPWYMTQEIAEVLHIAHSTVHNHLMKLGIVSKREIWVHHELKEIHLVKLLTICDFLLKRGENDPLQKRMVIGDDKWIVYNNVAHKRSWRKRNEPPQSTSKANIYQKKLMLSMWRDFKSILPFALLPKNQTINSAVYCQQLNKLINEINQKRPELVNRKGVVFHHENVRPHTNLVTRQKL